jgi:hypothetical protein
VHLQGLFAKHTRYQLRHIPQSQLLFRLGKLLHKHPRDLIDRSTFEFLTYFLLFPSPSVDASPMRCEDTVSAAMSAVFNAASASGERKANHIFGDPADGDAASGELPRGTKELGEFAGRASDVGDDYL